MDQQRVLFVCTHNSARSQMAEGMVNYFYADRYQANSAGTEKTRVHPLAIQALSDLGIDISHHHSKTINQFMDQEFDLVVTVCDNANETCPYFPNAKKRIHVGFEDPSVATGSKEERLLKFKTTRDEIQQWLKDLFSEE